MGYLLVANIGSTSFKFRLFDMPSEAILAKGTVERIGDKGCPYTLEIKGQSPVSGTSDFPDYGAAITLVEKGLAEVIGDFSKLDAVGFKPVMAKGISGTRLLDETVLSAMEEMNALFPAHNPPYIAAVREFTKLYPSVPCIGTFETAFYDNLSPKNRIFPVPRNWETNYGIRRFGFHGASHRFVTSRVAELVKRDDLRIISCHLGGSSSIACVQNGTAINSSWGMTAQSGLPQNNRVGDFDVFALVHLLRNCGMDLDTAERLLTNESGLKGMSGLDSGDIRDIREAADNGNAEAQLALDVYVASIRKYIGQFLVEMNGADVIAFTAGISENNPDLRYEICRDLDFAGIELDADANASLKGSEGVISTAASRIQVMVVPTNEEIVIARNAWEKLGQLQSSNA